MSNSSGQQEMSQWQMYGIYVFVFFCGVPALELNGFGFGIPLTLSTAIACATIGGAVGGCMICSRPLVAGLVGGLVAGPVGLLAVYYYTQHRESVSNVELVLIQGLACLPGYGLGWLIRKSILSLVPETVPEAVPELDASGAE